MNAAQLLDTAQAIAFDLAADERRPVEESEARQAAWEAGLLAPIGAHSRHIDTVRAWGVRYSLESGAKQAAFCGWAHPTSERKIESWCAWANSLIAAKLVDIQPGRNGGLSGASRGMPLLHRDARCLWRDDWRALNYAARSARAEAWRFLHPRRVRLPTLPDCAVACRPWHGPGRTGRKLAARAIQNDFWLHILTLPDSVVLAATRGLTLPDSVVLAATRGLTRADWQPASRTIQKAWSIILNVWKERREILHLSDAFRVAYVQERLVE